MILDRSQFADPVSIDDLNVDDICVGSLYYTRDSFDAGYRYVLGIEGSLITYEYWLWDEDPFGHVEHHRTTPQHCAGFEFIQKVTPGKVYHPRSAIYVELIPPPAFTDLRVGDRLLASDGSLREITGPLDRGTYPYLFERRNEDIQNPQWATSHLYFGAERHTSLGNRVFRRQGSPSTTQRATRPPRTPRPIVRNVIRDVRHARRLKYRLLCRWLERETSPYIPAVSPELMVSIFDDNYQERIRAQRKQFLHNQYLASRPAKIVPLMLPGPLADSVLDSIEIENIGGEWQLRFPVEFDAWYDSDGDEYHPNDNDSGPYRVTWDLKKQILLSTNYDPSRDGNLHPHASVSGFCLGSAPAESLPEDLQSYKDSAGLVDVRSYVIPYLIKCGDILSILDILTHASSCYYRESSYAQLDNWSGPSIVCDECGDELDEDDSHTLRGTTYCQTCYDDAVDRTEVTCPCCGSADEYRNMNTHVLRSDYQQSLSDSVYDY